MTLWIAACGAVPPASVVLPRSPLTAAPAATPTYTSELPPATPAPAPAPAPLPWTCPTTTTVGSSDRLLEFSPIAVAATAAGPTVDAMPRDLPPRAATELSGLVRVVDLGECYRWAAYGQVALGGTVEVALAVDEFGAVEATLAAPDATWTELADCVRDVFAARRVLPFVARRSVMRVPFTFTPTTQAPPSLRPARPAVVRLGGREHCTLVAPPAPAELAAPLTPYVIDAFDDDLEHARERRREALEARRHGGTRASSVPTVRIGEPTVNRTLAAATIKAFLGYQRGAYGACFAAARAAGMIDGTAIELEATIELDGRITGVRSRTAEAPVEAARCLEAAVAAVPLPPSDGLTRVRLTLVQAAPLEPAPPLPPQAKLDEIVAGAAAAAGAGYADLAARRYGALLAQLPDDPRACGWRVARLAALREAAPWIGAVELGEVQALMATVRPGDAACVTGAAEQLMSIATTPHALGVKLHRPTLLELAVARYTMLAPLASYLPDLARFRLEAEGALDRY